MFPPLVSIREHQQSFLLFAKRKNKLGTTYIVRIHKCLSDEASELQKAFVRLVGVEHLTLPSKSQLYSGRINCLNCVNSPVKGYLCAFFKSPTGPCPHISSPSVFSLTRPMRLRQGYSWENATLSAHQRKTLLSLGPIISPQTSLLKCHLLIPFNTHFHPAVPAGLTTHLLGCGRKQAQSWLQK